MIKEEGSREQETERKRAEAQRLESAWSAP